MVATIAHDDDRSFAHDGGNSIKGTRLKHGVNYVQKKYNYDLVKYLEREHNISTINTKQH